MTNQPRVRRVRGLRELLAGWIVQKSCVHALSVRQVLCTAGLLDEQRTVRTRTGEVWAWASVVG